MHLQHSLVELEVLLARIDRGELDAGWGSGTWDRQRQQLLVDTVLRGWPIPPVVVADGDERDVLVDGRERLLALWRFVRDELPVERAAAVGAEQLDELDGLSYSELPERVRRGVRRYGVPVVHVGHHSDGEVLELLSRWDPPTLPMVPSAFAPARAAPGRPVLAEPPAVPPPVPPPAVPEQPAAAEQPVSPGRPGGAHRRYSGEPIFDELSAWFLDAPSPGKAGAHAPAWSSPADPGHEAARSALRTPTTRVTPAGLPMREPAAHLAPGAIHAAPPPPRRPRSHDARLVGEHLTRFREGASAAREDLGPPR
ncbi:DUF262 domain-containing protein [Actinomycetospora cinnamomea]|uniref:DUF262 domain-containing protein n=1 Tax=Actinomycetospora cinnamomea TaxID=663609 RepID=A0A2U1FIJ8_9PSEU|nr:DUF262 domain-containing protein [Actinomycetospora cinnamomea]PVZ11988.1 hypothetical protein C8D89_103319 [Actinomycetospora cinnamomea]